MEPALTKTDHRPWPLPPENWGWKQSWNDVLFVHYPCPKEKLSPLIPKPLDLQEFEGKSWLGIVPLRMDRVTMRPFPPIFGISNFSELNVRVYVEFQGKPGIYFLSLDTTSSLAVWIGKHLFHLPYKNAEIEIKKENEQIFFHSKRMEGEDHREFSVSYTPTPEIFESKPGTLEYFFTERYCLYTRTAKSLFRGNVHHVPWPLQKAQAQIFSNTIFPVQFGEPHILYSKGVDVLLWNLERISLE
ncbi:MAG: YqjF family protein [Bacteriovoracales bacterium]